MEKKKRNKRRWLIISICLVIVVAVMLNGFIKKTISSFNILGNENLESFTEQATIESGDLNATSKDGYITIDRKGNRIDLGFAITSDSALGSNLLTTKNYTWTTIENETGIFISSNNIAQDIKIYGFKQGENIKLKHEITQKVSTTGTSNIKFWYVFKIPQEDYVYFNSSIIYPKDLKEPIHLKRECFAIINEDTGRIENRCIDFNVMKYFNFHIGKEHRLSFVDLFKNQVKIHDIYIGDGKLLGETGNIFAISVNSPDGILTLNKKVTLDPILTTTGHKFPNQTGLPFNQWSNCGNIKLDDGVYSGVGATNTNCSASNFSFLQSEGGNVTNNAIIQSILVNVDGKGGGGCLGGEPAFQIGISLSGDAGSTYTREDILTWTCPESSVKATGGDADLGIYYLFNKTSWTASELSNSNFRINLRILSNGTSGAGVDYVSMKVFFVEGAVRNVTDSILTGTTVSFLAINNQSSPINVNNVNVYVPFEFDDTATTSKATAEFSYWAGAGNNLEGFIYPVNTPPVLRTGVVGNGMFFNGSSQYANLPSYPEIQGEFKSPYPNGFTVGFWFNRTGGGNAAFKFIHYGDTVNNNWDISTQLGSSFYRMIAINTSGSQTLCSAGANSVVNNVWTYATAVYDPVNSKILMYKNGDNTANCTFNGPLRFDASDGISLASLQGLSQFYTGMMDEVLLVSTPLSASDINKLYNNAQKFLFQRGELDFNNLNITGNNTINVTALTSTLGSSNITVRVGNLSGTTYVYGQEHSFSSNANNVQTTANYLNVSTGQNFSLRFTFNINNNVTSPHMEKVISIQSWFVTPPVSDTCTYTSGNWNVNFADNCTIVNQVVTLCNGCNLSVTEITGTGIFIMDNTTIRNIHQRFISGGIQFVRKNGARLEYAN